MLWNNKYEIELKTEVERVLRFVNGMKVIYSHEKHLFAVEENLPSFLKKRSPRIVKNNPNLGYFTNI